MNQWSRLRDSAPVAWMDRGVVSPALVARADVASSVAPRSIVASICAKSGPDEGFNRRYSTGKPQRVQETERLVGGLRRHRLAAQHAAHLVEQGRKGEWLHEHRCGVPGCRLQTVGD